MVRNCVDISRATDVFCIRLGNVLGLRESVIPLWEHQKNNQKYIQLTDKRMTRFIVTEDEVYRLIEYALRYGKNGEIVTSSINACNIFDLAKTFCKHYGLKENSVRVTGIGRGEKLYEELLSLEETSFIYERDGFFHIRLNKQISKVLYPRRSDECDLLNSSELDEILNRNRLYE